jgi:uncharacterized membrane protein
MHRGALKHGGIHSMFDIARFHPLIVHAPLVLIPMAILFQLLHLVVPKAGLRIAAVLLLAGGVAGAVLATETGNAAGRRAEQVAADMIPADGFVPQAVADGKLLATHARLGEWTRNIYGALLLVEGGLLFLTLPVLARFRRGFSLPAGVVRLVRGVWMSVAVAGLVIVVLAGHYGGSLVYDHAVGTVRAAAPARSAQPPPPAPAQNSEGDSD